MAGGVTLLTGSGIGCSSLTVLHIDDDADTRFLARELLQECAETSSDEIEIRWLEAGSVEEAVVEHSGAKPDAILLDNYLGPRKGVDLLPLVRSAWACPVWIVTSLADPRMSEKRAEEDLAGVIEKDRLLAGGAQLRSFLLGVCGVTGEDPTRR